MRNVNEHAADVKYRVRNVNGHATHVKDIVRDVNRHVEDVKDSGRYLKIRIPRLGFGLKSGSIN